VSRPDLELAPGARAWMLDQSWPGNLRQLRNVLERGLILAGGGPIDPPPPEGTPEGRPRPLLEVEKEMSRNALAYTRGHQGQAADLLGISRKALWEKRKRYGIP
jgi:transcriptional regulator of acetoin/glycerol metabolism